MVQVWTPFRCWLYYHRNIKAEGVYFTIQLCLSLYRCITQTYSITVYSIRQKYIFWNHGNHQIFCRRELWMENSFCWFLDMPVSLSRRAFGWFVIVMWMLPCITNGRKRKRCGNFKKCFKKLCHILKQSAILFETVYYVLDQNECF